MNDYIRRQDAIDALEKERQYLLAHDMTGAEHILVHHALNVIEGLPSVQPENNIVSNSGREPTKNDIIMLYHKVYGCTIINAEQAHEKALEYLRDKAMLKG